MVAGHQRRLRASSPSGRPVLLFDNVWKFSTASERLKDFGVSSSMRILKRLFLLLIRKAPIAVVQLPC